MSFFLKSIQILIYYFIEKKSRGNKRFFIFFGIREIVIEYENRNMTTKMGVGG